MKCSCENPAPYEIRGTPLCTEHYIEALEHSAHVVSLITDGNRPEIPLPEPSAEMMKKHLDKGSIY